MRLRPGVRLHWRAWADEWVVFDEASGNTHLMDPLTACALLCLEDGPLAGAALASEVAEATELPAEALHGALGPVLERLQRLGLVDTPAA